MNLNIVFIHFITLVIIDRVCWHKFNNTCKLEKMHVVMRFIILVMGKILVVIHFITLVIRENILVFPNELAIIRQLKVLKLCS